MQPVDFADKFEGFVLAGGKSSRMGKDKAFLKIGEEKFFERAARVLSSVCRGRVRIVLNPDQRAEDFSPLETVSDVFAGRGAPGAIHAALRNSKSEWTIALACDLPLVAPQKIASLAETALNSPPETAAVVPRQPDGRLQPLCAVYRTRACLAPLEKLLRSNDSFSVRDFLAAVSVFSPENETTPPAKETAFFNVNTFEDYKQLLEGIFGDSISVS
jgi:molybdopterin-guanine dinucleotide biosynthesis protein A